MARSKRILSYEAPPARRPRVVSAADDAGDDVMRARPMGWGMMVVCLVTLGCIAGLFAMGPVSDLDSPMWETLQDVMVFVAATGMLVMPVMCLLMAWWDRGDCG
jgi:hypothetical protein